MNSQNTKPFKYWQDAFQEGRRVSPLHLNRIMKELSRITLFFWLRAAISKAYGTSSEGGCTVVKMKVHEVRSTGAPILFKKNFGIHWVLRAGTWTSESIFTPLLLNGCHPQVHEYLLHRAFDGCLVGHTTLSA